MQKEFPLDPLSIDLIRRLEDLLDFMEFPESELLPHSGLEPRCSHKAPSGYPIDYELWLTLEGLADAFRDLNPQLGRALIVSDQVASLSHFPSVQSLGEGTFWDVFGFLRAASWVPLDRDELEVEEFTKLIRQSIFDDVYNSGRITAALKRLKELCGPTEEDILRVLRFKSIFDSLTDEQFRSWNGWEPMEIAPSVEVLHMPYPSYHPAVWEWNEAVYQTKFYINPYRGTKPGEPIPHPRFLNIGDRGHPAPEEFFAHADIDEVRQYMAVCLRGERWCDGHIASEFERGVIHAAFRRLDDIFKQSQLSYDI